MYQSVVHPGRQFGAILNQITTASLFQNAAPNYGLLFALHFVFSECFPATFLTALPTASLDR